MAGESIEGNIVVYGKKTVESPNLAYRFQPNISGNVYSGGTHSAGNTNTVTEHEVAVNARWEHAENKAEVLDAAQQIAKALTAIEEYIDRNPTAVWTWDNHTYSSAELRSEIDKTQFIVTDATEFDNGGVGSATHGVNGAPNIDIVSAHCFASTNPDGYASPNYSDQGVMAMMLHELGHMTDAGFSETAENVRMNRLDHGTRSPYNYSEYWHNDENFAHDIEKAAAEAMHMNVSQYELTAPNTYGMWQPAREIYDWHHGIS